MNMQIFNTKFYAFQFWLLAIILALTVSSCKNKDYIYGINDVPISPNNAEKNKQKTNEQYLNISYANLYQKALSPDRLVDLSNVITSLGDKQVAYEIIIAKMMTDPDVKLPSKLEVDADPGKFIVETYKRFFVREPTQAEKVFFINFLKSNPNITAEHVYFAFATSTEYYFY